MISKHFYRQGGLAVAVPGEIAGYWKAHQIGGRLPWKRLFEPTIDFCQNGIQVSIALEEAIRDEEKSIRQNEYMRRLFIDDRNQTLKENDTFRMPELARTLQIISERGPSAFYDGLLSHVIVSEINMQGRQRAAVRRRSSRLFFNFARRRNIHAR